MSDKYTSNLNGQLDQALLNGEGYKRPTTMSKERIALLKIARIVQGSHLRSIHQADIPAIEKVLTDLGVLARVKS